jgi:hypothetical protein
MGEPVSAEAATSERDVLLATKLNVPRLRPDLVPRPRLAQRLDQDRGRGLALICAPAGCGNTVLLTEWVRRGRNPVAWLSLDIGDNDPARFWRHAVAALDQSRPGISERLGPLLGPPAPPSFEPLVTALINEVAGQPDAGQPDAAETLLVLDDYHVISSQPVHESLRFLLEHRPPGLHLALASRSDPPLALARLRARGQLAELRAEDLRFTPGEAAALLRQVTAAPGGARPGAPPDAFAAALAARTEGWAAGLQLAALSLRGQDDVDGFVAAFTGSHRYVLDYLTEEVLERQSEQVRTFLLETSVLERLSGELCDAVTGRPGCQELLEQTERAGLFLVPLDEVRGWWRYHHLFADLLRARLQAERPGGVSGLHRNAAAQRLVDAAELAYAGTGEEPFEPTIGRAGSLLVNVPALIALCRGYLAQVRGDAKGTAEAGARALAESQEGDWIVRSVAHGQLAVAEWLGGRLHEAERGFAEDIAGRRAADLGGLGKLRAQLGSVRSGPAGRGRADLRAGAGSRGQARPAAAAGRGPGVCGAGRGGLPAERARPDAGDRDPGHRAVPVVRLHDAAGRGPGHAGLDPAGRR